MTGVCRMMHRCLGGLLTTLVVLIAGCVTGVPREAARCADVKEAEAGFGADIGAANQRLEDLKARSSDELVRAQEEVRNAYKPLLVLIEQNPECYTAKERAEAETLQRELERSG